MLARAIVFGLFVVVQCGPVLAITGGVAVDEVLAGGAEAGFAPEDVALAQAISRSTVSLAILDAQGRGKGLCTGSIVHPRVVLTAAHCVFDGRNVSRRIIVFFGGFGGAVRRQALDAVVPPDLARILQSSAYRPGAESLDHFLRRTGASVTWRDFALILLHRPIPETHEVVDIVAPGFRDSGGAQKAIAGYGLTAQGASPANPSLHFAEMPGSTRTDQGAISGRGEIVMLSRYKHGGRVNTCNGDSGGPIFVMDRHGGTLRQLAVASIADEHCREFGGFASIDRQRTLLRAMFDTLMQGEQGAAENPF